MQSLSNKLLFANLSLHNSNLIGRVEEIHDNQLVLSSFSNEKITFGMARMDMYSSTQIHFKGMAVEVISDNTSPGAYALGNLGEREITVRFMGLDASEKRRIDAMAAERAKKP